MPSEGHRLHGFTVVTRAISHARQLVLPAILGGVTAADAVELTVTLIVGILTIPALGIAVAQWLAFRYRLEGDELVIDSGVVSRRRRVIPVARVQNVDLEQGPLERLAGVASLRLETASGGGETEASLAVLELAEARSLQAEIMRRRAATTAHATADTETGEPAAAAAPGTAAPPPEASSSAPSRTVLRLSPGDLVLAGATSNEAGLIAAGLATLLEIGDDLWGDWIEQIATGAMEAGSALGVGGMVLAGAGIALVFVVAGWLVSIVATVVRFWGFTLTRSGDDLRREYGLLSRHHSTVPLERVQAVRIEETLLRRPLRLAALKIETAGAGPQQQGGGRSGGAEAFVPLARRRDVGRLLREVFEDARFEGVQLNPVHPVARRRAFVRLAVPIGLAAAVLLLATGDRAALWLLLLLVPAWLLAGAQYRARGWARPGGYTIARNGVTTRTSWVVPERKIQTVHLRETPFQRRWSLGTLLVDTAAGGRVARVVDLARDTGMDLLRALARDGEEARRRAAGRERSGPISSSRGG